MVIFGHEIFILKTTGYPLPNHSIDQNVGEREKNLL
jgi:hypothetical protein